MIFLVVGLTLLVMKFAEIAPVTAWSWWAVLMPFPVTLLWWWYADASGLNKRREMDRMEDRKAERRSGLLSRLGLKDRFGRRSKSSKQADRFYAARQRQIDKVEGKRAEERARHRDSVLRSRFDAEQSITRPSQVKAIREASTAAKAQQPDQPASAHRTTSSASTRPAMTSPLAKLVEPTELPSTRYSGFAETVPVEPKPKAKP